MSYHLFLDDERLPRDVRWIELPVVKWEIVRSYNQFVKYITERNELPVTISFDHDLAEEHYPVTENRLGLVLPYDTYKEKTGYHAALWLIEWCRNKNQPLPRWFVHTLNITGRYNIIELLTKYS